MTNIPSRIEKIISYLPVRIKECESAGKHLKPQDLSIPTINYKTKTIEGLCNHCLKPYERPLTKKELNNYNLVDK